MNYQLILLDKTTHLSDKPFGRGFPMAGFRTAKHFKQLPIRKGKKLLDTFSA